jgi:methylenetetrahydrofolate dehydrogenase (NADP+) / methenyltetrahydrofolate cyclohydrolase
MKKKIARKLNIIEMMNSGKNMNITNPLLSDYQYKEKIINGAMLSKIIQDSIKEKMSLLKFDKTNIIENFQNFDEKEKFSKNKINNFSTNKSHAIPLFPPKLKVILVGDRPDSKLYVENKLKMCKLIGVESQLVHFPSNTTKSEILEEIEKSNKDDSVHGIIIQLPLPEDLNNYRTEILSSVDLRKDVDGLNPLNQGKILQMGLSECLLPPTAMGVLELLRLAINYSNDLEAYKSNYLENYLFDDQPVNLSGMDVTVLGRGLTAGLPLSILMQKCNGTVTLCHSKTSPENMRNKCQESDILISAVGKSNLVSRELVKSNSIVIDVGINVNFDEEGNKIITGDVEFDNLVDKVKFITPVPGGVGKMTVIMLLKNVVKAWSSINKINLRELREII